MLIVSHSMHNISTKKEKDLLFQGSIFVFVVNLSQGQVFPDCPLWSFAKPSQNIATYHHETYIQWDFTCVSSTSQKIAKGGTVEIEPAKRSTFIIILEVKNLHEMTFLIYQILQFYYRFLLTWVKRESAVCLMHMSISTCVMLLGFSQGNLIFPNHRTDLWVPTNYIQLKHVNPVTKEP